MALEHDRRHCTVLFSLTSVSVNLLVTMCILPFVFCIHCFFLTPLTSVFTFSFCSSVLRRSLGDNFTGFQNWYLFVFPFWSFVFKNETFKYAFFLVIEVKESELFHFVYLEAFYAVHYILFTNLGRTVVNDIRCFISHYSFFGTQSTKRGEKEEINKRLRETKRDLNWTFFSTKRMKNLLLNYGPAASVEIVVSGWFHGLTNLTWVVAQLLTSCELVLQSWWTLVISVKWG